jgi:teichuronic acid biosynthesis glycosyltransferase TuaC
MGARSAIQGLLDEGFDFDVIDAHYYYPDGVAAALLAKHFNKPFTVTARGSDINQIASYPIPRILLRWAASRAYASIGVSRALTQLMAQMGMPASTLMMMPNGVDLDRFHIRPKPQVRNILGWPDVPTLLCVGNLVENKGHGIAITALTRLPEFQLVIVGQGPERNSLEQLARQMDVSSRIKFLGQIDQEQLAQSYSAADILVLPSSREGWPNVLLESMACGTPVVATKVGGIPEIVTSAQAGRLMVERRVDDLVEAVTDLWQNFPQPEAVRQCAQACGWHNTTLAQIKLFSRIAAEKMEQSGA